MIEVERAIWRSSDPISLLKQGHLEQAAQNYLQMAFEYLQGGRLHSLSRQSVPVLNHRELETQVLFCKVVLQLGSPEDVQMPEIVPSQVQDFAFSLVELREVPVSPFLQPVKVILNGSTTLWCISHFS